MINQRSNWGKIVHHVNESNWGEIVYHVNIRNIHMWKFKKCLQTYNFDGQHTTVKLGSQLHSDDHVKRLNSVKRSLQYDEHYGQSKIRKF